MTRRLFALGANIVLLTALLVALQLATNSAEDEVTARIESANCLDGIYRVPAQRAQLATMSASVTIRPVCGGGFGGKLGGPRLGGPMKGAGWTKNARYGARTPATKPVKSKRNMKKWKKKARKKNVPVPNKKAKRAKDMSPYNVYQIYRISDNAPFKYGITKTGKGRPLRQIRRCDAGIPDKWRAGKCTWKWVRRNIDGWYKARLVEMVYATRYKTLTGKCPPGMPRCL